MTIPKHTLEHVLVGCDCDLDEITRCVICGQDLKPERLQVDTCGDRCYEELRRKQRERGLD